MATRKLAMTIVLSAAVGTAAAMTGTIDAMMGPPLVCHSLSIGTNPSLPWEGGPMSPKKGYDRKRLVRDTLELLKPGVDMIVRMETLRRAAIYAGEDEARAWELIAQLSVRALQAGDATPEAALAEFDTGFVIAVLDEMHSEWVKNLGTADGVEGYACMKRAIAAARNAKYGQVAAMEFGAALMTLPEMRHGATRAKDGAGTGNDIYDAHIRAAARGAEPGSLLETNLAEHLTNWKSSLEKAKAAAKTHEVADATGRK